MKFLYKHILKNINLENKQLFFFQNNIIIQETIGIFFSIYNGKSLISFQNEDEIYERNGLFLKELIFFKKRGANIHNTEKNKNNKKKKK